ncbi:polysaccharide pyruvyl transferase family protein [Mesobacillus foraminis]|uniref:Colanic acid/amylovoran biosynthesis protein n=1 Tax=Mesobacillus foraminis TaxID=279826 RepID=A0A4R2B9B3_9BACI|nr:polysaccharide pyruvyl transferase family protein [Mesobacillus foraminis]TCN22199.1 colanic acid/amylovoran biosynthesis protein [Mesobacillus foraminis]
MKKILVDIYLQFNLGDDLFLDVLAKKYPECKFTVNHLGKNYDDFLSKYKNVTRRKYTLLNKIGQRLKITDSITNYNELANEFDALLFIGGSIFREEEYHHSLYNERIKIVSEFKDKNKPVFVLGANFGPYQSNEFITDYRKFFEMCDDVCFRDKYSYQLFNKLPQVRYAPDIVFQMDTSEFTRVSTENTIGFSIIDVRHKQGLSKMYNDYIESTVKSIELCSKKGYKTCLMSFCEAEGDHEVIKCIKSRLSDDTKKYVLIYEYKGNLKEALHTISTLRLFVASRFHANILALLLGIGVMPIIYSEKTTNMLKDIKADKLLINMNELHLQYNEDMINLGLINKFNLGPIQVSAKSQFEKLNDFLENNELVMV